MLLVVKKSIALLLVFMMPTVLVSCSDEVQKPLRISSSPWPGYEPLYLARDLGYLGEKKVNIFELPSADITLESFRNHSSDMATLTLDGVLELMSAGVKLRIVLVMNISNGGDAALFKPGIKSLSELKGKRVASVNIPLGIYMVERMLDKAGLERKDIELFLMSETEQEQFYKQGKADVVVGYAPVTTRLQNLGMKVLFDSSDIPNEIFDILVVHENVYQARKEDVCGVVKQWFKTQSYMRSKPQDAAKKMANRLGVSAAEYNEMMLGLIVPNQSEQHNLLGGDKPELLVAGERLQEIMQKEKMLRASVNLSAAIDPEFVNCIN